VQIRRWEDGSIGFTFEDGDLAMVARPTKGMIPAKIGQWGKVYKATDNFVSLQLGGYCFGKDVFFQARTLLLHSSLLPCDACGLPTAEALEAINFDNGRPKSCQDYSGIDLDYLYTSRIM